jgi:hypothetical protein
LHETSQQYWEHLAQLCQLQIPNRNEVKNPVTDLVFQSLMNFKRDSNLWEKYDKFSKISSLLDLHKSEFSWVHLYVRFQVTKQVSNDLVRIKEKSLNLNSSLTIFDIQPQLARISFKLPKYLVSYRSGTVAATVTLGVSQPSPLTEISSRDLEGVAALTETVNNCTIPHYGKMKSEWREQRKSSLFHVASSSEWLLHYILKNLIVLRLMT